MFLRIIIILIILSVTMEIFLHKRHTRNLGKACRALYYAFTVVSLLPYILFQILGSRIDLGTIIAPGITSAAFLLFASNLIWKAPLALSLLISKGQKHTAATIFSLLATLLLLYGALWERHQLRTTHLTLHYDNLPAEADGIRIVQISDLHIGNHPSRYKLLERLQREIAEIDADLIIDCGDMVNIKSSELDSVAMTILSRITAPLGQYTVMGNHDRGDYIIDTVALPRQEHRTQLIELQSKMGWQNITDSTVIIPFGSEAIYLTAINYPASLEVGAHGAGDREDYSHHFDALPRDAFNIVVAHTPVMWPDILEATPAELTLSGHVHAMQLRLPIGPRGWSPAALVYKHWSGLYAEGSSRLFVSDGVGSGIPIRIGVKPQIVVITLKKMGSEE